MQVSGIGGSWSPQAMTGASARMPPSQKMSSLFDKIDTSGSGSINKADFLQAFQNMRPAPGFKAAGADAIWSKLDPNYSGTVSKQSFVSTMTGLINQFRSGTA